MRAKVKKCLLCGAKHGEPTQATNANLAQNDIVEPRDSTDTTNDRTKRAVKTKAKKRLSLKQRYRQIKGVCIMFGKIIKLSLIVIAVSFLCTKFPSIPASVHTILTKGSAKVVEGVNAAIERATDESKSVDLDAAKDKLTPSTRT